MDFEEAGHPFDVARRTISFAGWVKRGVSTLVDLTARALSEECAFAHPAGARASRMIHPYLRWGRRVDVHELRMAAVAGAA